MKKLIAVSILLMLITIILGQRVIPLKDIFQPKTLTVKDGQFKIFNTPGEEVFSFTPDLPLVKEIARCYGRVHE